LHRVDESRSISGGSFLPSFLPFLPLLKPCEIQISKSLLEIMNDWGELTRYTQQNSKTEKLLLQLIVESFGALHQGSSLKSPNIQESECDRLSCIHI
jgi:hypothetical protein